jgi:tetratricopeptide (TPR) repeat protein
MPNQIDALLRTACTHAEHGQFDTAASTLHALLTVEPGNAAAMQLLGLVQARQGDLRGAARTLRQACLAAPDHGPLHVHLARVEWELGLPAQAAAAYQRAIALGCATPDMLIDCAIALEKLERHAQALDLCQRALAQAPMHARGWQTQANLLHAMKRLDEALACHDRALELMPDALGWSGKALTLDALDRLEEALACHDRAAALCPDDPSMLTHRGITLGKMKRLEEAVSCHARATELAPRHATAWSNLGAGLCKLKRLDAAIAAHDKAVSLAPSSSAIWLQRAAALLVAQRQAEALASCNAAIRLDAHSAEAWRHRALALESQGRYEDALESVEEACALDIDCLEASYTKATLLFLLDRDVEAVAWLAHRYQHHPGNETLRFALGLAQLRNGDYAKGWVNYQAYRSLSTAPCLVDERIPLWSGAESLAGKHVLVHAEQGYGDVIQFCRLIPRLASMGCVVYFLVYPALEQLLSRLDGCRVLTQGEPLPACDYRIPLMALPQFILQSEQDIPSKTPYLRTGGDMPSRPYPGLRIGIACSGNPKYSGNPQRSAPLASFERLQRHGDLFILQNALEPADAAWLQSHPSVRHPTAGFTDFADTADLLDAMDLVISVDTSIAHLAGALGKPLWVLLPCSSEWRWKSGRSTSSLWYPTARLFRQAKQGNWEELFCRLDQELAHFSTDTLYLQRGAA